MSDLISRQAAIDALNGEITVTGRSNAEAVKSYGRLIVDRIRCLPSAEPVRHGKWIGHAGTIGNECSVCGKWIDVLQGTAEMNYCPHCGCRMDAE